MFNNKTEAGLDIGEQKIKLIQIKKKGAKSVISNYGTINTPPGTMESGFIVDPETLGAELAKLVDRMNLRGKKVVSAVSGPQVYTRLLTMPSMKLEELRQAALFQASSFLPISIDEVTTDIYPVREFQDEEGKKTEVFFVAARKSQVDNLMKTCDIAGLKLMRVEIEPLGLYRDYIDELGKNDKSIAVVNIGASRSYVAIFKNEVMVFMRSTAFGCAAFYEEFKMGSQGKQALEEIDIRDHDSLLRDIVTELTRSLDYYQIQHKDEVIEKIILCGGGSRIPGIDDYLSSALNQNVEIASLSRFIKLPEGIPESDKRELRHDFPVALGLALRGVV